MDSKKARRQMEFAQKWLTAAQEGDLVAVKKMVAEGCSLDMVDEGGDTALMCAAVSGKMEMVDYLIGAGCDIDASDIIGRRALHLAVCTGKVECVRQLIEAGCELDACEEDGTTALMCTVMDLANRVEDSKACLAMLLSAGCELDSLDERRDSALDIADSRGLRWAVEMIESEHERRAISGVVPQAGIKSNRLRV